MGKERNNHLRECEDQVRLVDDTIKAAVNDFLIMMQSCLVLRLSHVQVCCYVYPECLLQRNASPV